MGRDPSPPGRSPSPTGKFAVIVARMANTLPKQAFVALAAVGWADGTLTRPEATALLDAARKHGLEGDDLAAVERSIKATVALAAFEPGR